MEIGGGFGELSAKMKMIEPELRSVIFDLPEPGAVQHYFLRHRYPQAKVYTVRDYQRLGVGIYDEPFDFLLLPPALIKSLPTGWPAISVNIRSFQEMNWTSVVDYFVELQRAVTTGGVFCCINRFSKTIGDHEINYDRFPFDGRWRTCATGKSPSRLTSGKRSSNAPDPHQRRRRRRPTRVRSPDFRGQPGSPRTRESRGPAVVASCQLKVSMPSMGGSKARVDAGRGNVEGGVHPQQFLCLPDALLVGDDDAFELRNAGQRRSQEAIVRSSGVSPGRGQHEQAAHHDALDLV